MESGTGLHRSDARIDDADAPRKHQLHGAGHAPDPIRAGWDTIASAFDRFVHPLTLPLGDKVVERVGVVRGVRFLDVAAGTGALSIPAARRGADVLATDISPTMVECLAARARTEGLANVEVRIMDGHALQLEDDSFDVAASQNGVSLFPDFRRGLAEMVRVTRPGGRVAIVNFAPVQQVEFLTFFMGAMRAVIPGFRGLPTDPPPLPFQVADPEILTRSLEQAGLTDVQVEQATLTMEFSSGQHLWDAATSSNPLGAALVADLTQAQHDEVRRVLDGMLRERTGSRGGVLQNGFNIAIGRK